MKPKLITCSSCRSFTRTDDTQGNCRRYPPQVIYAPVNPERPFVTTYPTVRPDMPKCGEYRRA